MNDVDRTDIHLNYVYNFNLYLTDNILVVCYKEKSVNTKLYNALGQNKLILTGCW